MSCFPKFLTTLLLLLFQLTQPAHATDYETHVWINTVPGYSQLSSCGEYPLSTIVRDMENGCGDGSRRTSYACFCTTSFFKARWDISTAVISACGSTSAAQATSAVHVFEDYCGLGVKETDLVATTFG